MRIMYWLGLALTPLAFAVSVFAGVGLWESVTTQDIAQEAQPAIHQFSRTIGADIPEPQPPRRWPEIFGVAQIQEPQPPQPPAPPKAQPAPTPPLESLGYTLKGVVRISDKDWAIVGHPTGEVLLTVGDKIAESAKVVAIDAEGLWVSNGESRRLLAFAK